MAFIIKDRVKEATTSTGTGDVSLGGAAATFDTFQSYMTNGDTTYYAIVHTTSGTDEWEVGLGTWNTGNTITRTTVLAGSNGTSAVNFSAGTKDVFMTYPAAHAALAGDDVNFANITITGTVDGRDVAADGSKLDTVETNADVTDAVNVAAAGALMKSGGTMTGNLILNADPTTALGAATKEYVDTIASAGIHYHDPVRVETPSALTASYDNGSSGVGATLTNSGTQAALVIDGVTMTLNDRVLVYNQTNEAHNGIYTVTNVGSASTNWVMTRATDADSYGASDPDSFGKGDAFFVKEGNTGAGELYVMTTAGTITFGTTAIHFSQVAETAVYNAGTGLTLTGTTFSIGQDVGTTANVTFNQVTAAIIGNVIGNLTGDVTGNADTATALETARTIQLSGDVTGSATFDGTANVTITAAVQDDSHAHVISNVDGLQAALDAKADDSTTITAGDGLTGGGSLGANRTLNVGAGSGISVTADAVAHADTSTQASVNNSGRTYIQDITLDGFGHVTGLTSATETVTDTTYTAGAGLDLTGTTFSHTDTSSQASVNNSNGTVIQDITLDTYGHITGIASFDLDGRYYTETEADSRFVNVTGDTMSGQLVIDNGSANPLELKRSSQVGIEFNDTSVGSRYLGVNGGNLWFGSNLNHGVNNKVFHDGYHPNADKWTTARTLSLSGDASGSVSWDGSANATLSVTVANDSHNHSISTITDEHRLFNNMGDNHTTQTNFNSVNQFGVRYLQGGTNGPTGTSSHQWYGFTLGLGNDYAGLNSTGDYGSQFYWNRQNQGGNNYIWIRDQENGTWGSWRKPYAGKADAWTTARTLSLSGDASGSVSWDGSANATLSVTVANDSHSHSNYLSTGTTQMQDAGFSAVYWNEGNLQMNADPRWNQSGYNTNEGNLHIWATTGAGAAYGQAGIALYNGGAYQYLTTKSGQNHMYINNNKVWTQGNDGSGSGLDADLLDGVQGSSFLRSDTADSGTTITLNQLNTNAIAKKTNGSPIVINSGLNASKGMRVYYDMDVYNTVNFTDASWNRQGYINGSSGNLKLFANGGSIIMDNGTSTTVDIKCDDAGNARLNLCGDNQGTGILFVGQSTSYGGGIEYNGDNSPGFSGAGADYTSLYRVSGGTVYWTARNYYNNNDWQFRGNVTAYASDERLKENIQPISDAVAKVQQLNGVTYDWRDECESLGFMPSMKSETGVIAQNVQQVIPDAVTEAPFNSTSTTITGEERNYLTVDKEKIIPLLIEAIKEQQAQIDELKAKLEV